MIPEKKYANKGWESRGKHRKGSGGDAWYRTYKKAARNWFMKLLSKDLKAEEFNNDQGSEWSGRVPEERDSEQD